MREMKDSGIPWIGKIPKDWGIIKGKYILTYLQRPILSTDKVITCFRDGEVTLRSNRREEGFTISEKEIGYQGINVGDLVVHGMDGFAGSIGISDSRGKASPVLNVLNSSQDKKFLMYYLRSMAYNNVFLALSTGIRVRSCDLNWNKLANLPYTIPSIKEQQQIADYLDTKCARIDSIRKNVEAEIEALKQYKQSVITEAVTKGLDKNVEMKASGIPWIGKIPKNWKVCPLKYNFKIISGSTPDSNNSSFWDGNINWITPADFKTEDVYITKGSRTISEDGYKSCGTTMIPAGNIIFSKRAPIGSVVINKIALCTNQGCFGLIKETPEINTKYYYYILGVYPEVFNFLGTGTTFKEISAHTFSNVTLPFPPVQEQHRIADYLDTKCSRIDSIIQKKQDLLANLDTYKKSMIYEYVTGKKEVPAV